MQAGTLFCHQFFILNLHILIKAQNCCQIHTELSRSLSFYYLYYIYWYSYGPFSMVYHRFVNMKSVMILTIKERQTVRKRSGFSLDISPKC